MIRPVNRERHEDAGVPYACSSPVVKFYVEESPTKTGGPVSRALRVVGGACECVSEVGMQHVMVRRQRFASRHH